MEPSYQLGDRSALVPHTNHPPPFRMTYNKDEECDALLHRLVHTEKTSQYCYEEQAFASPLLSPSAPPGAGPSRTGYYLFGDTRSAPVHPMKVSAQNGDYHYDCNHHYHYHCGDATIHCHHASHGQIPSSIDPTHLLSRPPVGLAQREPMGPEPSQPPMALLWPLTHALPKEYHKPTCLQHQPPSRHPVQESVPPETPIRGQSIPGRPKSRRTKTSYDPKTSYMLNMLFFETFGHGSKPGRYDRSRIQRKTGISPRHLTYWLSNHKRRFKPELTAYVRLVQEGKVHNYDSFIEYCKKCNVPELQGLHAREDTPHVDLPSSDADGKASMMEAD